MKPVNLKKSNDKVTVIVAFIFFIIITATNYFMRYPSNYESMRILEIINKLTMAIVISIGILSIDKRIGDITFPNYFVKSLFVCTISGNLALYTLSTTIHNIFS